jgi:CRISPR-associated protein Cas7/Cse4/CasC subtype I-E
MRIEIHVLQNFAPSNLNRDDTGSPKDAEFGGYRRARISSQCIKRAIRWDPSLRAVVEETFARRSNMHARQVAQILTEDPHSPKPFKEAYNVGRYIFQKMGFKEKKERLTVMLLLGGDEIKQIAEAAATNWEVLSPLSNTSLLWKQFAEQIEGYLSQLSDEAEMLGRLIANHKAGSANASTLLEWLHLPQTSWSDALEVVCKMPADFLSELNGKYNTETEEVEESTEEDEEYVPKPAAALFKKVAKNKAVIDALGKIEIKAERGRETAQDDKSKKELTKKLNAIFTPLKKLKTKAVNVALFGRMIAEIKDGAMAVDAACQVAHAISTNRIAMESDYFTAVEELKELAEKQGVGQDAGAGMIGTVEFNSACFYRYANLDLGQLRQNLQNDEDLVRQTAMAFLRAFVHAVPTGKQNSFAAHNKPSLVFAVVRDGLPLSLANAFVRPIAPHNGESLVEKSIDALDDYYGRLVGMYGDCGLASAALACMENCDAKHLLAHPTEERSRKRGSVDELIQHVVSAALPGGGAS